MTAVLTLSDVTLTYPDGVDAAGKPQFLHALERVNYAVHPSTVNAIVGPSGSGKSSLLSVAATLIAPTSGSVQLKGQELSGLRDAERTRLRASSIGIVFQQPNLIPSLTAVEQLLVSAHMRGARGAKLRSDKERAYQLLETVGLGGMEKRRPHQLSGGQRQRVNIARALMGYPQLLLADEPTSALDAQRSASVMHLLRSLTEDLQLATVIVTHDLESTAEADTIFQMKDGRGAWLKSVSSRGDEQ